MSRTRSLFRRRWAARQPGVRVTQRSHLTSLDTLPWQAQVSRGRPCGAHGSRTGAPPEVTPSRVTLQRSAGSALLTNPKDTQARSDSADVMIGVDRGEWAASNSQTFPQRPRQTGLPGPTPCTSTANSWGPLGTQAPRRPPPPPLHAGHRAAHHCGVRAYREVHSAVTNRCTSCEVLEDYVACRAKPQSATLRRLGQATSQDRNLTPATLGRKIVSASRRSSHHVSKTARVHGPTTSEVVLGSSGETTPHLHV